MKKSILVTLFLCLAVTMFGQSFVDDQNNNQGNFNSVTTGWNLGTNAVIKKKQLRLSGAGATTYTMSGFDEGKSYKISFDLKRTSGSSGTTFGLSANSIAATDDTYLSSFSASTVVTKGIGTNVNRSVEFTATIISGGADQTLDFTVNGLGADATRFDNFVITETVLTGNLKPYLQTPTDNSIWVTWQTDFGTASVVEYGTDQNNLNQVVTGTHDAITGSWIWHKVKLTGLTADTPYYYRVKTDNQFSSVFRFRTQPVNGASAGHYRFIILGDHQRSDNRYGVLVNAAKAKAETVWGTPVEDYARLIVNTGDVSQEGNLLNHWKSVQFGQGAALTQNIPCVTVVGNHDDGGSFGSFTNVGGGIGYYSRLFTYSDDTNFHYKSMTGEHGDNYYAFQVGSLGFLMENSNQVWQDQYDYIDNVADTMKDDPTIEWVFNDCHHPMYAEQVIRDAKDYVRENYAAATIRTGKAGLIMSGHAHLYARGAMEEDPTFHIINGGASWDQYWTEFPDQFDLPQVQKTIIRQIYTLVDVDLDNNTMKVDTYSIGSSFAGFDEDKLVDSFTFKKETPAPNKPAMKAVPASVDLPYEFEGDTYVGVEPNNSTEFQFAGPDGDFDNPIHSVKRDFENIYYDGVSKWKIVDLNEGVDIFKLNVDKDKLFTGTNFVRVRYRDQSMRWSEWSEPVGFVATNGDKKESIANLIAYFPFTSGSILDESSLGVNFDAATNSGATASTNVEQGDYMEFDNNDMITIQKDSKNGLPTDAITVATWVKVDAADVWGGFVGGLFQDNGPTEHGWVLGTRSKKFSFALSTTGDGTLTYLQDNTDFTIGQWYYVVGTYDGEEMKLYVDGELKNSAAKKGAISYISDQSGWFQIGSYKDLNEDFRHDGGLDEIRIWDGALSASEVSKLYNGETLVAFSSDKQTINQGESIQFNNQSTANNVTGYSWEFEGGSPATSTSENPSITYNAAGVYKVKLTVTTASGSDSKELLGVVTVKGDDPNLSETSVAVNTNNFATITTVESGLRLDFNSVTAVDRIAVYSMKGEQIALEEVKAELTSKTVTIKDNTIGVCIIVCELSNGTQLMKKVIVD